MFNAKKPEPQKALPPVQPVTQRYHEQAMQSAQHMLNLEHQLEEYVGHVRQLQAQNGTLRSQLDDVQAELIHSRNECDHYRRRCIEIETRLLTASDIIRDTLKPVNPPVPVAPKDDPHDPPPLEDIEDQIHNLVKGGRP